MPSYKAASEIDMRLASGNPRRMSFRAISIVPSYASGMSSLSHIQMEVREGCILAEDAENLFQVITMLEDERRVIGECSQNCDFPRHPVVQCPQEHVRDDRKK